MGYFEATETMTNLIGRHVEFAEAKKFAADVYAECRAAHLALEQHWAEHGLPVLVWRFGIRVCERTVIVGTVRSFNLNTPSRFIRGRS